MWYVSSFGYFCTKSNSRKWFVKRFILCIILIQMKFARLLSVRFLAMTLLIIFHFASAREKSILVKRIDTMYERMERTTERHTNVRFINAMSYIIRTIRKRSSEFKSKTVWQQAKIPKHQDIAANCKWKWRNGSF